jgi:SAM-dependent methyltransferase
LDRSARRGRQPTVGPDLFAQGILPAIAKAQPQRVLFVGVRGYTRSYTEAFRGKGIEFWTSDIDPAVAKYGSPNRHVTEDLRNLGAAFPPKFFDVAILNGVFGWGVDSLEDIQRALVATEFVLAPGGIILLGYNSDRSPDPEALPGIELFEPVEFGNLPHRKSFSDVTHVYAWYRKRTDGGSEATAASG